MKLNILFLMITITNGTVLCGSDLVIKDTNILIDEGKIIELSPDVVEGEIIDASDCIVCPSFLNAHTHIGDSIVKDIGDGKSIEEIVKPPNGLKHIALEETSNDSIIDTMEESMWNMLETGTTHFIDYREGGLNGVKLLKKASKNVPITPIILGRDDSFYEEDPDLSKVKIAIKKLLKICDGIAPSGFGEINEEVAILIVNECKKKNKIASIHAGEYEDLQIDSLNKTGKTEIQRAIGVGFDQLIHITSPMKEDLELIGKYDKNIVLCPRSNGAFSVGIPPILKILKKGIRPLIGTDNIMINSPNILRELEYTLKIIRAFSKNYVSPKEILKMATTNHHYHYHYYHFHNHNHNHQLHHRHKHHQHHQHNKNNHSNDSISNKEPLIDKSIIEEGNFAELFISKKISKNPYLSLINRTETKDIICLVNKDKLIYYD
jgi:cytosine/adenosine deaminase-related metal-dependent hydrolase